MRFRQFLEAGTQGLGPGASGARGAPPISGKVSQVGPVGKPKDAADTFGRKKIPPSAMTPRGLGAPMEAPKAGISGNNKWQAAEFSPMSLGTKWKQPDFSPFSSKNKWAPRTVQKQ